MNVKSIQVEFRIHLLFSSSGGLLPFLGFSMPLEFSDMESGEQTSCLLGITTASTELGNGRVRIEFFALVKIKQTCCTN